MEFGQAQPRKKNAPVTLLPVPLSLMCHLAVKSRGNNRITFQTQCHWALHWKSPVHIMGKEKTERALQVSKCHRRTSSHHMHTPCFVSDTTGTIYTYIMRLSGLYCSQYILPVQREGDRTKPSQELNAVAALVYTHMIQLSILFFLPCVISKQGDWHFSKRKPDNTQHPGAHSGCTCTHMHINRFLISLGTHVHLTTASSTLVGHRHTMSQDPDSMQSIAMAPSA